MYDTIIIGAGMSGLAAGIRLAYYDQRVCILERHTTIGGLNSFYRLRGRDYDVGLHAVTNFTAKGAKKGPLARILRQLRFSWDDFGLSPQLRSAIKFPGVTLEFGNSIEFLAAEIAREFPNQKANFARVLADLIDYDDLIEESFSGSARKFLSERISDRLLVEMLLCPLMWYGNAREGDMDLGQFCIMFRSIFLEGFARPFAGVRLILKNLVRKYRALGGELKLRSGVERIETDGDRATAVILENGARLEARNVLSSAGWVETMRLCDRATEAGPPLAGQLSFTEAVSVLDREPERLGFGHTIVFFNDSPTFTWEKPETLCDVRTGVICSPNNYAYSATEGALGDNVIRITALANFAQWSHLPENEYRLEKIRWFDRTLASAVRFMPDFRSHVIDSDMFTPKTIRRFTHHDNGAVYGAPQKHFSGQTHLKNMFICGTDQGYVGIIGSIMSGISMANKHLLAQTL